MILATSKIIPVGAVCAAMLLLAADAGAQELQRRAPSVAPPAAAQPPASGGGKTSSTAPVQGRSSATTGGPEFRDPKTGQVWTPDNVGQDNKGPVAPEDRAFDPSGQAVASGATVEQRPQAQRLGTVPITAGPTVPLVVLSDINLRAVPADHWLITIELTNNSANTYVPIFVCSFDNGSKPVSRVQAIAPTTGPGERLRLTVVGPATSLYVDKARCDLTAP